MQILLVNPKVESANNIHLFPLGLGYISAVLKKAGHEVYCLYLDFYKEEVHPTIIRDAIISNRSEIFAIGGLSRDFRAIKRALKTAREVKPDICTVVGGGVFSSEPEIVFNALNTDFGVLGEGDETIVELIEMISNNSNPTRVNGIAYRDSSGAMKTTDERYPINDLDSVSFPNFDGFGVNNYLSYPNAWR
jgi:anaerobic magnesium-protoporphyrin IX monomethyl ester cyclase